METTSEVVVKKTRTQPESKKHAVHWKLDELDKVAARAVLLMRTGAAKSDILAVSQAQSEVLSLDRQRRIYGKSHLKCIQDDLNRHLALYDAAKNHTDVPVPALVRTNAEPIANFEGFTAEGSVKTSPRVTDIASDLSDKLAASILSVLVPAFADIFQETMDKVIQKLPKELHMASLEVAEGYNHREEPPQETSTLEPRKVKQKVVLLGFRPETSSFIGDFPNLNVEYCQEVSEVRRAHSEGAILLQATKFSAHLPKDIKRKYGRICLVRGGYNDAKQQLHALDVTHSTAQTVQPV